MPISQMRNGLTAENSIFSQKPSIKVSRSRFDLSRLNCFTSDIGMIVPVDVFETLPGDQFNLGCQYKIDFRPLLVPTLTSYKVKVHYYYCPYSYLWEGWESFISKGRSGNLALQIPQLHISNFNDSKYTLSGITDNLNGVISTSPLYYYPFAVHSLLSYMLGNVPYHPVAKDEKDIKNLDSLYLPFYLHGDNLKSTGYKCPDVSALPFLMYQKIYRSNYLDPNLYSNGKVESKVWFPDDIDSSMWRINYKGNNYGGSSNVFFVPDNETLPSKPIANFVPIPHTINKSDDVYDNAVNLTQLRYSMYTDDMFTTALPFLQRGPQTMLDLSGNIYDVNGITDFHLGLSESLSEKPTPSLLQVDSLKYESESVYHQPVITGADGSTIFVANPPKFSAYSSFKPANKLGLIDSNLLSSVTVSSTFTAQQLRSLLALSVWQERNALTNGSYGQFIKVHFDNSPNNKWCEPVYIGGTTSTFNINSVVQTSESGVTPQGNQTGIGGSSNGSSIGTFTASDFGLIMALMTIIPDNVYSTLNEHLFLDKNPDDFYMPEYEQLSYQPILNKQLFFIDDEDVDNGLFGYSNRYVYLKQRESIARGMFSLPSNIDAYYHSYVQARKFSTTPKLTQHFVTVYPPNIDRSFLAYPGQPAFLVQYYSQVNAVRSMSYASQPNTFGF